MKNKIIALSGLMFLCVFLMYAGIAAANETYLPGVDPETGFYYNEEGQPDETYTGYANSQGYVETDARITEPYQWYVVNGVVAAGDNDGDRGYEGLYKDGNNVWRYYRYGRFQSTTTGFATDMTRLHRLGVTYRYRIEKGLINFHFTGLAEARNNRYYEDGRWMLNETGYKVFGGNIYYVKDGCVPTGDGKDDWGYEGLYKVDGVWRYFRYGKFQKTTTGFITDKTRFCETGEEYRYRIANGMVNFSFTGVAEGSRYYENGINKSDYNGIISYAGTEWIVMNGRLHCEKKADDIQLQLRASELTREFIDKHSDSGQTNEQRFRSCFRWLLSYMYYKPRAFRANDFEGNDWPYRYVVSVLENTPRGNCFGFACTVASIAKELGYSPRIIITTGDHGFVEINGKYYDNMGGGLFGASRPAMKYFDVYTDAYL